ncbi:MAG: glycosyl hydrolase 53 family protein [Spongiibacteraceae bacterium]|nr:glycosyl hydrolase 53 family protein [Spongiibacteraceae bacterium]
MLSPHLKEVTLAATLSLLLSSQCHSDNFIIGADLSYVNQMEDCGAQYRKDGKPVDPFTLFANNNFNLVRVRLWHTPSDYSNFADVTKTIQRAKDNNLPVLLDFHYSDTWADPDKQHRPKAWSTIKDTQQLADKVYQYTFETLSRLQEMKLYPQSVQIGNETNIEILQGQGKQKTDSINWKRNITLLNSGIQAVHDANARFHQKAKIMLHIAQPENAVAWFPKAHSHGIAAYDYIGLSYYEKWSTYNLKQLSQTIKELKNTYTKDVIIVETAYPWTLKNFDGAGNLLGKDALVTGYPASKKGQQHYLSDLLKSIKAGGGSGMVYWEPAWVSTPCKTQWGQGSHWENASFFDADNGNEALPVFKVFNSNF